MPADRTARLPRCVARTLTAVTRVAAALTLASAVPAAIMLWSTPASTTVHAIGVDSSSGVTAYVMVYPRIWGLALAVLAIAGVPIVVCLATFARRRAVRLVAYALLGAWLARWLYGFAAVLAAVGARAGGLYWTGLLVSAAAVAGAIVGAAAPPRPGGSPVSGARGARGSTAPPRGRRG